MSVGEVDTGDELLYYLFFNLPSLIMFQNLVLYFILIQQRLVNTKTASDISNFALLIVLCSCKIGYFSLYCLHKMIVDIPV